LELKGVRHVPSHFNQGFALSVSQTKPICHISLHLRETYFPPIKPIFLGYTESDPAPTLPTGTKSLQLLPPISVAPPKLEIKRQTMTVMEWHQRLVPQTSLSWPANPILVSSLKGPNGWGIATSVIRRGKLERFLTTPFPELLDL
jgi:hypothetical protein